MIVRGQKREDLPRYGVNPGPDIYLVAGDVFCCVEPSVLSTVLGSCVAVCLWDRRRGAGGMNHFVLPSDPAGRHSSRYGDVAMDTLMAGLMKLGCRITDLEAKVFGGAAVLPSDRDETIGGINVRHALQRLQRDGIPVTAQRTGGLAGKQVRFHTATNEIFIRAIQSRMPLRSG